MLEFLLKQDLSPLVVWRGFFWGEAYAKAMFCLKTVTEAMERLPIERFVEDENADIINSTAILNLVQSCNRENLQLTLQEKNG